MLRYPPLIRQVHFDGIFNFQVLFYGLKKSHSEALEKSLYIINKKKKDFTDLWGTFEGNKFQFDRNQSNSLYILCNVNSKWNTIFADMPPQLK